VLAKPFAAEDLLKRLDAFLGPLAPRVSEAPAAAAPAPTPRLDGTPTLMPVSALMVAPLDGPRAAAAPPAPSPMAISPAPATPTTAPSPPVIAAPPPAPVFTPSPPLLPSAEPVTAAASDPVPPLGELPLETEPAAPPAPMRPDAAAGILAQFTAMDGVQWAVLSDREGFVVEATTNAGVDADVAAALSACLAESSDGLGKELGRGPLQSIILEYDKGMIVVYGAGAVALLAIGLTEPAILGKVRYFAKKALPELTRSV
jgi:predicted regulator of Ras-like GTPase activity (Roadblock/LC7/MglB family)